MSAKSFSGKQDELSVDMFKDDVNDIVQTGVSWADETVQEVVDSLKANSLSWYVFYSTLIVMLSLS